MHIDKKSFAQGIPNESKHSKNEYDETTNTHIR